MEESEVSVSSAAVLEAASLALSEEKKVSNSSHERTDSDGSGQGLLLNVANLGGNGGDLAKDVDLKEGQTCHSGGSGNSSGPESIDSKSSPRIMGQVDSRKKMSECRSSAAPGSSSVIELQGALQSMQNKLLLKDEEIARLSRIRDDVEAELEDLTASLFEEAHKMVRDANVKQASAEKALAEATMKIEGLETEVAALKTLVLTSTPSQPNVHLHPQINLGNNKSNKKSKGLKKETSGSNDSVGSASSSKQQPTVNGLINGAAAANPESGPNSLASSAGETSDSWRSIDPCLRKDYLSWKKNPTLKRDHPFVERIYKEDIDLCLAFPNETLTSSVIEAIHENALCLSPVKDFSDVPRNCSLLNAPVLCKYSLRLLDDAGEQQQQQHKHFISQLARNRLAAVCDCVNYLRYVEQGLVKAHVNDVYWEIMRLRRQMTLARLGFSTGAD